MIKNNGWLNTLVTLIMIVTPALIGFYLMFPGWRPKNDFSFYWYLLIPLLFMLYATLICIVFIKTKILAYEVIAFLIPVALVFSGLFLTAKINISPGADVTIRVLIGIVAMIFAFPMNVLANNLKEKRLQKLRKIQQKNLRNI